ncbi:MAG: cytochrome c maturation protein CcmE [Nitrospinaceae bacterium]
MTHKKAKFAIGSMLIVGAIGFLISTSISTTSKFFLTVDELAAQQATYVGAGLKVKGKVVRNSIQRDPNDRLKVRFAIEENNADLRVVYEGITPDMFVDGREVVVEGTLMRDGVFHANTLLTSCPSKYEAEQEAGKEHPGALPNYNGKNKPGFNQADSIPKTTI